MEGAGPTAQASLSPEPPGLLLTPSLARARPWSLPPPPAPLRGEDAWELLREETEGKGERWALARAGVELALGRGLPLRPAPCPGPTLLLSAYSCHHMRSSSSSACAPQPHTASTDTRPQIAQRSVMQVSQGTPTKECRGLPTNPTLTSAPRSPRKIQRRKAAWGVLGPGMHVAVFGASSAGATPGTDLSEAVLESIRVPGAEAQELAHSGHTQCGPRGCHVCSSQGSANRNVEKSTSEGGHATRAGAKQATRREQELADRPREGKQGVQGVPRAKLGGPGAASLPGPPRSREHGMAERRHA